MTDTYSVWTFNDDPEWLASSAGVPDYLLVPALDLDNAHEVRLRIATIAGDRRVEIRNASGRVVTTERVPFGGGGVSRVEIVDVGSRPPRQTPRPARRTLGTREG